MTLRWALLIFVLWGVVAEAQFDGDPIYERTSLTNGARFFAVRPFYSHTQDPSTEREVRDYFWPLYTRKTFKEDQYSRFLFFGYSYNFSPETDRRRVWVLPIYFKGVDIHDESYFAIFPLGGTVHEILGLDEVKFVLFPIYAKWQVNDVRTKTVFWPIYSKSQSPKVDRFRVWPFYGRSSLLDEYNKKFILWPFYSSVEYINDRNPGGGFILFPIYGRVINERSRNYWVIPPFFRYSNSEEQRIIHAPWPFIQIADGEMYKRYVWPIYGKKHIGNHTTQFFIWPFVWNNKAEYLQHTKYRRQAIPFFYYESDVVTLPTATHDTGEVLSRYWKIWPLMSWERNDQDSRFRTLELWPLRNTPGVERNWAPYWSLYRRVHEAGETGHHLLWGLYRQSKGSETFEWSLLKGLVGYKKEGRNRSFRLLFMWFNDEEVSP